MPVFLAPWLGPLIVAAAPWLARLPGIDALRRWARTITYVAVLALGVWGGVRAHAWWTRDNLTPAQAAAQTEAARQASLVKTKAVEIAARERALADKEATLAERERLVAAEAAQIDEFTRAMESDRATAAASTAALYGDDDQWLRAWRRRGY